MQSGRDALKMPCLTVRFGPGEAEMLTRLQRGRSVSGARLMEQLQRHQQSLARGFDRLLALDELDLDLYDHQLRAVTRVLRDMRGRAVLADEVGLGKTIEAGVILKEYIVRGLARSALILAPASLTEQWRQELRDKVDIDCHVYRAGDLWSGHERIITTLDTARRPEHGAALHGMHWDVVIVDEAHRLKNRRTRSWQFVDGLQKKYLLLLTATPIQNDLEELYNTMTLLQPGLLQTYSAFKREFMQDKRAPKRTEQLRRRIGQVLVRTTRSDSGLRLPRRIVHAVSVPLSESERVFYERVLAFARSVFVQCGDSANVLPLILLLRELCSSAEAVQRTLLTLAEPGRLTVEQGRIAAELAQEADALCGRSSKLEAAVRWLRSAGESAVVFTQFRATQTALAQGLQQHGVPVTLFHGAMDAATRRTVVERFRHDGGVLISTEAGSEGQNLQFCRTVINWDLPWNPMRVEQRIGRVHRLGQTRDVLIVNLLAPDTMEMHVFRLLHEKIRLFEQVIGELDVILARNSADDLLPGAAFEHELGRIFLQAADEGSTVHKLRAVGADLENTGAKLDSIRQLNERWLPAVQAPDVGVQASEAPLPAVEPHDEGAPYAGRSTASSFKPSLETAAQETIHNNSLTPEPVAAQLLHPLCLDVDFAASVLGRSRQAHRHVTALRRRLETLQFVNAHARPLGRRLLHQAQWMFCFRVAYRSDETRERLHTLFVDPVTERVRLAELPDDALDLCLERIGAEAARDDGRIEPYVLERLYGRARERLHAFVGEEGQQYIEEARLRLERDAQRLDQFYEGLQDEALIPVVQQLRRLETSRTREHWLRAVAPQQVATIPEQGAAGRSVVAEAKRVKQRLELIQSELDAERERRLAELTNKYAVRADVRLVAAALVTMPRVELRYKIVGPVREELTFYYDPLQDTLIDFECCLCGTVPDVVHMNGDGEPVCADCFAAAPTGSG